MAGTFFAGAFFATLIIVSVITVKISDKILDSRIGALDRTLGFLFGLFRGLIIVVDAVAGVRVDGEIGEVHLQLRRAHQPSIHAAFHQTGHRHSVPDFVLPRERKLLHPNGRILDHIASFLHTQEGCGIDPDFALKHAHHFAARRHSKYLYFAVAILQWSVVFEFIICRRDRQRRCAICLRFGFGGHVEEAGSR